MERSQIQQILRSNVDHKVKVCWKDGSSSEVTVVTVDHEGFVYDLVPPDPKTAFWSTFDEVSKVAANRK